VLFQVLHQLNAQIGTKPARRRLSARCADPVEIASRKECKTLLCGVTSSPDLAPSLGPGGYWGREGIVIIVAELQARVLLRELKIARRLAARAFGVGGDRTPFQMETYLQSVSGADAMVA
jgi:hypothetical protein